jgi:hypothetical protein
LAASKSGSKSLTGDIGPEFLWKEGYSHSLQELQRQLCRSKKKFQLRINRNRSTMLSVRWDPTCTHVSLHEIFLSAPKVIISDLATYLIHQKEQISPNIRAYIDTKLKECDFSHKVDPQDLLKQGKYHNLDEIYYELNERYFDKKRRLHITWFGRPSQKKGTKITLGLFEDHLRLIKIHRIMDQHRFPKVVVAYVVYHEMVHDACPSYYDEKGVHRVHSKEFKERELLFEGYDEATTWLLENSTAMFLS